MARPGQRSWLPGQASRLPRTTVAAPVADNAPPAPLRRGWLGVRETPLPGHSGGTAPDFHRTSLDHRPYVAGESTPMWAARPVPLLRAAALLDLLAQPVDDFRHRLLHPAELPVLDLDHAQRRGRDDVGGALLSFEQALLAEDVAGAELADLLAVALDLRGAVLDPEEVV